jgi:hypothetical protein
MSEPAESLRMDSAGSLNYRLGINRKGNPHMFVTLQPHSNTNPSDNYRVVDSTDWARYVNGASNSVPFAGEFGSIDDAITLRDDLNAAQASAESASSEATEFREGFRQANITPIEMIRLYAHAENAYQRGWNTNIIARQKEG